MYVIVLYTIVIYAFKSNWQLADTYMKYVGSCIDPYIGPYTGPYSGPYIDPYIGPYIGLYTGRYTGPYIDRYIGPYTGPYIDPYVGPYIPIPSTAPRAGGPLSNSRAKSQFKFL